MLNGKSEDRSLVIQRVPSVHAEDSSAHVRVLFAVVFVCAATTVSGCAGVVCACAGSAAPAVRMAAIPVAASVVRPMMSLFFTVMWFYQGWSSGEEESLQPAWL